MTVSIFNREKNNQLLEPMFLGNGVNVARYDQQRFEVFEKITEKQLSFFWRPEEVDVTNDRSDFMKLPDAEKHIFISNLKYQILLDSIQGRSPSRALLPIASLPEIEVWLTTWTFSESIHSRSYTHIIRNVFTDPSIIFDDIVENEEILKRAEDICVYYDNLIELVNAYHLLGEGTHQLKDKVLEVTLRGIKKALYLCIMAVNALEAVRFYVSFACSFAFAEGQKMIGNAGIIRLIARDEALHLNSTQHMLSIMQSGADDPEFAEIAKELEPDCIKIFELVASQEKDWGDYLFKDGAMIGLNKAILSKYVDYITNVRMKAVGLPESFPESANPIPWINSWLSSDAVQVAPQEMEIPSYLIGQIDSNVNVDKLGAFEL